MFAQQKDRTFVRSFQNSGALSLRNGISPAQIAICTIYDTHVFHLVKYFANEDPRGIEPRTPKWRFGRDTAYRISTIFSRAVAPEIIRTRDGAMPRCSASAASIARFA